MTSVHWSGIRARRLSSHHGEFCKLFCSHTSRDVDFFSEDGSRSGEQLLNMIGMCSAFSIGGQILTIGAPKGSISNVFLCKVHSSPPVTFSVVASAHDPSKPAADKSSKHQQIKLWMVTLSAAGDFNLDERKILADTHVTFSDDGYCLPSNIYAGCRYDPICIQGASFQLQRPDFRSLYDVGGASHEAVKCALDMVKRGAAGQQISKDLKDLLNVDADNHKALKFALDVVRKSALDSDMSAYLNALFSTDPEDHAALKSALDYIKQGLHGADFKYPGVIDFRNKLCHNLLTLDARSFDALVSCARNVFLGIQMIHPFVAQEHQPEYAGGILADIDRIVQRDMRVAALTDQEIKILVQQREQMLEERDRLKVRLSRKFDSFAPCLKRDIQDQLVPGALLLLLPVCIFIS
jgi:hypothetical protein